MASSSTRRTRRIRAARDAARRDRADRLLRDLRDLPPELRARVDALDRWERAGDARAARDAFVREGLPTSYDAILDVLEVARLDDLGVTPSWVVNRWVTRQALRSLPGSHPGVLGRALDLTGSFAAPWPEPAASDDLVDFSRLAVEVLYRNWLACQVGIYEEGGLTAFLDGQADERLLARTHRMTEWASAPWGVYWLGFCAGGTLAVRDLRTGDERLLLHLGVGAMHRDGDVVLGRIAPVEEPPGEMFESAPIPVDEETAERLARDDLTASRVCTELRRAVDAGRLPPSLAAQEATDLVSDVEERRLPALLAARNERATYPADAVELFDVVTEALSGIGASAAARTAPVLLPSLFVDAHLDALRRDRTRPRDAEVWRHVAHDLPAFARARVHDLLSACGPEERATA